MHAIGISPHMHLLGREMRVTVTYPDGTSQPLVYIDDWDFHWQEFYFYETPVKLTASSLVQVTCEYDTSADTQPVLPGWGTRNEMCLNVLMVALAEWITPHFSIDGFWSYIGVTIVIWVVNVTVGWFLDRVRD